MDTACERTATTGWVGTTIEFHGELRVRPVGDVADSFLATAEDTSASYDVVVDAARFLLESTTSMCPAACETVARSFFLYEDPAFFNGSEPGSSEMSLLRAQAMCEVACAVALGPYSAVEPEVAAQILLATLQAAGVACGDAELAFCYLDEAVAELVAYHNGYVESLQRLGISAAALPGARANVGRMAEVLAAAGLTK